MTKPIKLTENDFDYIHWNKDSGGPELFELIIYGKSKSHCNEIKQQILQNQEITENIKKLKEDSNNWLNIDFKKLKDTDLEWNNDKTHGFKTAIADFHTHLEKILGENSK